jgi:hypothetical protein
MRYFMSILLQVPDQPRTRGVLVGTELDDEGFPYPLTWTTQAEALSWWVTHKARFEAEEPYAIVRGTPQPVEGLDAEEQEAFLADLVVDRPYVKPVAGGTLRQVGDSPAWA